MNDIYVITAYRWGLRNGHSYVVNATHKRFHALRIAINEYNERGGKYGIEVIQIKNKVQTRIAWKESNYFGQCGIGKTCDPVDHSKTPWKINEN